MRHIFVAASIAAIALLGMFVFPGHTWLQSDTQIYAPMLERLWNPEVFSNDLIALRPHIAWTIYDETALLGRALTGLSFEYVLLLEQILFRILAIWGVYLIGRRFHESPVVALFTAGIVSLGATIVGPSVLSFEYEPVPRGFAVSLLLCAIGLAIHGETVWASIAGSLAFLYHAPTTLPFWLLLGIIILRSRRWQALIPPMVAMAALIVLARIQPGITESQHFFSRIPADIEQLQRLRAPYNWTSQWPAGTFLHYGLMWIVGMAAFYRLRTRMDFTARLFFAGFPAIGILSIPLSWLLLEQWKWALMPQVQPARMVLLTTICAVILCCLAAAEAVKSRRIPESIAWLVVPFLIPIHSTLTGSYSARQMILIAGLALAAGAALNLPKIQAPLVGATLLAAMFLIPTFGGVVNYAKVHSTALDALATWARTSTPVSAMFVFPTPGKSLKPGIFRAKALRAIYADWKAGGQVNYFDDLGREWWWRWQRVARGEVAPEVDYAVYATGKEPSGQPVAYRNDEFVVIHESR